MFGKLCFISVTINKTPNMSKIYSPMLTRHASLIYNFVGSINNTPNPYTVYNFLANPLPELMNSCPRNKKDTISSVLICILCSLCLLQLHDNPGKFFKSEFNTYSILVSNLTCFE